MLEPLGPRVLVTVLRRSDMTAGGLHVPDGTDDQPHKGRVLAIGPKVEEIKVDDVVMFGRFAGVILDTDDEDERYLLLEEELLARVPEVEPWILTAIVGPVVTIDRDGAAESLSEPAEHLIGLLRDAQIVDDGKRLIIAGIVDGTPAAVVSAIRKAGYVRVVARRGDVELMIWKADTTTMFGSNGRFNAVALDDSDGSVGGSKTFPLGCHFEGEKPTSP